jgi:NMD protein affecting ribosome stability and mRNA decay
MTSTHIPRSPSRRDRLLKQPDPDAYRNKRKLPEPTLCKICGAVFSGGRWQWLDPLPEAADETRCPACQRIHDRMPAGYLTLRGVFFEEHREEIMRLIHNHVERQRLQHPLQRIIDTTTLEHGGIEISFTEYHLPKGVGEAVKSAYQGDLQINFAEESGQERVRWER